MDSVLVFNQLALVPLFLLTLDSFHFTEECFYLLCSFRFVQPIILLTELKQVFDIGIGFFVDRRQTHHAFFHILKFVADFPFKAVGNIASFIEFYLAAHDVVAGKPIFNVNYLFDNFLGLWLSLGPEMLEVLIRTLRK